MSAVARVERSPLAARPAGASSDLLPPLTSDRDLPWPILTGWYRRDGEGAQSHGNKIEAARRGQRGHPRQGLCGDDGRRHLRRGGSDQGRVLPSLRTQRATRRRGDRAVRGAGGRDFWFGALRRRSRSARMRVRLPGFSRRDAAAGRCRTIRLPDGHDRAGGLQHPFGPSRRLPSGHVRACRRTDARHRSGEGALCAGCAVDRPKRRLLHASRAAGRFRIRQGEARLEGRSGEPRPSAPLSRADTRPTADQPQREQQS